MKNKYYNMLCQMITDGHFPEACTYTKQHISECDTNEKFVILYILFRIWEEERQAGVKDLFSCVGCNPEELIRHYTRIKLYLRRFEYNMPEHILLDTVNYFKEYNVSVYALHRIAQFACINPSYVMDKLASMYK